MYKRQDSKQTADSRNQYRKSHKPGNLLSSRLAKGFVSSSQDVYKRQVYEALCEFENEEEAYHRRRHRNKAIYSLDVGDGIENDATSPRCV